MAWSSSGLFVATQMDQWDDTGLGIDLTSESALKAAFWGSSVTPNFDQTGAAYGSSPWNSGEASGAGYSAGGIAVTGTTLAIVSGSLRFDADNFLIDDSTITAEGYLLYDDTVSDRAILAVWFGEPKSTEDGAFLVTHDPTGIAILDCVP
jgi:hypothetical protein